MGFSQRESRCRMRHFCGMAIVPFRLFSLGTLVEIFDRQFLEMLLNHISLGKKIIGAPDTMKALAGIIKAEIPPDTPIMPSGHWDGSLLRSLAKDFEDNGFEYTAKLLKGFAEKNEPFKIPGHFPELYRRIMDELNDMLLMRIPANKAKYYWTYHPFGDEVADKLPTVSREAEEAGNCLATDRNTAAVFHLMRGLEVVLKRLAAGLGVPDPTKEAERNWGAILRTISGKIDTKNKANPPDWQDAQEKEFYEELYSDLVVVKNAWRNKTMHVDVDFEETRAVQIYEAMKNLVQHAAGRLSE